MVSSFLFPSLDPPEDGSDRLWRSPGRLLVGLQADGIIFTPNLHWRRFFWFLECPNVTDGSYELSLILNGKKRSFPRFSLVLITGGGK